MDLVIFDLDGTLVDSLGDLADSMNVALESMGLPTHPTESYRHFVGDGAVMLARRAVPPEVVDEAAIDELVRRMRHEYARRWTDSTRPFPGVPELLAELRRRGRKTAVLSNKPDSATQEIVRLLFGGFPFQTVRGASPDHPLKPDPTVALAICSDLRVDTSRTFYVGDTDVDMETGRRAGMVTVGVTWGFRGVDELRNAGAARIIHHPLELLRFDR
jgi:phosphoglycolate phosphatase